MIYYLKTIHFKKNDIINFFILIMIIGGVLGFIYEEIFYLFDLGYLVKRGSSFGPWIPIYAFGSLFLTFTYRFRDRPLLVFIISLLITGLLEYFTGYFLFKVFNIRLWDYNTEILNFGNINGYICLRSVLLFGISGLFLVYYLIPYIIKIIKRLKDRLNIFCIAIFALFILDILLYQIIN